MNLKLGTILLAKPNHPERQKGGDGVAVIIREPDGSSFISIELINSKINPYCPEDVAAIQHINKWFDIIDDSLRNDYIPNDWESKGIVENILKSAAKNKIR